MVNARTRCFIILGALLRPPGARDLQNIPSTFISCLLMPKGSM